MRATCCARRRRRRSSANVSACRSSFDPDLRAKDWGTWEGLTGDERIGVELEGESTEEHRARMLRAIRRIAERHPDQRIVVVTHGGSLRRLQAAANGVADPVIDNCAVWSWL